MAVTLSIMSKIIFEKMLGSAGWLLPALSKKDKDPLDDG